MLEQHFDKVDPFPLIWHNRGGSIVTRYNPHQSMEVGIPLQPRRAADL